MQKQEIANDKCLRTPTNTGTVVRLARKTAAQVGRPTNATSKSPLNGAGSQSQKTGACLSRSSSMQKLPVSSILRNYNKKQVNPYKKISDGKNLDARIAKRVSFVETVQAIEFYRSDDQNFNSAEFH